MTTLMFMLVVGCPPPAQEESPADPCGTAWGQVPTPAVAPPGTVCCWYGYNGGPVCFPPAPVEATPPK